MGYARFPNGRLHIRVVFCNRRSAHRMIKIVRFEFNESDLSDISPFNFNYILLKPLLQLSTWGLCSQPPNLMDRSRVCFHDSGNCYASSKGMHSSPVNPLSRFVDKILFHDPSSLHSWLEVWSAFMTHGPAFIVRYRIRIHDLSNPLSWFDV